MRFPYVVKDSAIGDDVAAGLQEQANALLKFLDQHRDAFFRAEYLPADSYYLQQVKFTK